MKILIFGTIVALALSVPVSPAAAASYTFFQDGFDEGARITGSFEGTDKDGDGLIALPTGFVLNRNTWRYDFVPHLAEITAIEVAFSGNSRVPPFGYDLDGVNRHANICLSAVFCGYPQFALNVVGPLVLLDDANERLRFGDIESVGPTYLVREDLYGCPPGLVCGQVMDFADGDTSTSLAPVVITRVSPVPVPVPALLLLTGIVGLILAGRSRQGAVSA